MLSKKGMSTAITVLAVGTCSAQAMASPTGRIDFAKANEEWTHGSLTGSVSYDMCNSRSCSWTAFATVQPPGRSCSSREPIPSWQDETVQIVATVPDQYSNGTATIEATDVPILSGVVDQRLCLYLLDQSATSSPPEYPWPPCDVVVPEPPDPPDPMPVPDEAQTCPTSDGFAGPRYHPRHDVFLVDQRLFSTTDDPAPTLPDPQPPEPEVPPPPVITSTASPAQVVLSSDLARSHARTALVRRYGRAYTAARAKRLVCNAGGPAFKCTFSFGSGKKRRSGAVTVKVTQLGISARVRQTPTPPRRFDSSA